MQLFFKYSNLHDLNVLDGWMTCDLATASHGNKTTDGLTDKSQWSVISNTSTIVVELITRWQHNMDVEAHFNII